MGYQQTSPVSKKNIFFFLRVRWESDATIYAVPREILINFRSSFVPDLNGRADTLNIICDEKFRRSIWRFFVNNKIRHQAPFCKKCKPCEEKTKCFESFRFSSLQLERQVQVLAFSTLFSSPRSVKSFHRSFDTLIYFCLSACIIS